MYNPKNHQTSNFKLQSIENETIEKYEESQFKMEILNMEPGAVVMVTGNFEIATLDRNWEKSLRIVTHTNLEP